jgi:hypothetical protein
VSVEREICVCARRISVTASMTEPGLTSPCAARSTSTTIAAMRPAANTIQPAASHTADTIAARTARRRIVSASCA